MSDSRQRTRRRTLARERLTDALQAKREFSRGHFGDPARPFAVVRGYASRMRDALERSVTQLHAVGVGRKVVDGKATNTMCVRFYVAQKLPKSLMAIGSVLPADIAGIATDVIESPPAYFAAVPLPCSAQRLRRQRPVALGVSGANVGVVAGTLGARCRSRRSGESMLELILSNNHVLADFGDAEVGSAIVQPSRRDGGTDVDRIGMLLRYVPLAEGALAGNRVDAAVAVLDPGISMAPICSIGSVQGIVEAEVGMEVHKHGRTTGYTMGVIEDESCDFVLPFTPDEPHRVAQFVDQVRIGPRPGAFRFAQAGDSGSLVLTKGTNLAVGLVFACPDDSSFAYASPIHAVLDSLDVDLV